MKVSILILLEVILEVVGLKYTLPILKCFNPYFTGSNSGSNLASLSMACILSVSILILLEVILEELHDKLVICWHYKFQSLFYWK